jgi:hypothetical protein
MAIKIENAPELPALVFDRVFLNCLKIDQEQDNIDSNIPIYNLTIEYRLYAVDEQGIRHYQPKVTVITMKNYMSSAIAKAQMGDMDLLNAMGAIEIALAEIIKDQTDLGTTQVVR